MPKKTKREKIIADYRKKLRLIHESAPTPLRLSSAPKANTQPYRLAVRPQATSRSANLSLDAQEFRGVKRDLLKTVLFAMLAIAAELGLYWRWK